MSDRKYYAEINGKYWQASLTFCAGCPHYVISGWCSFQGNGCAYPEERRKRPINFERAFFEISNRQNKGTTELAEELGDCLPKESKNEQG